MGRKKKQITSTRNIFIPHDILYLGFLPWVEDNVEELDGLDLIIYYEDEDGADLSISGLKEEVDALTDFLLEEIAEAATEKEINENSTV